MINDKCQQTTLSIVYKLNINSITYIKWSIIQKIKEYVPDKCEDCSIYSLERMATAELTRKIFKYKK